MDDPVIAAAEIVFRAQERLSPLERLRYVRIAARREWWLAVHDVRVWWEGADYLTRSTLATVVLIVIAEAVHRIGVKGA